MVSNLGKISPKCTELRDNSPDEQETRSSQLKLVIQLALAFTSVLIQNCEL